MHSVETGIVGIVCRAFAIVAVASLIAMVSSYSLKADSAKEAFNVIIDQAKLLPLSKQSSAVIVGNPSIADVTVQNGKLLVVTGKSYGTTNLIVLDTGRNIIVNKIITVIDNKQQTVQLFKGSQRMSFACKPKCTTVMNIGDEAEYVKNIVTTTSNKAALVSGGSQQGQGSGQ